MHLAGWRAGRRATSRFLCTVVLAAGLIVLPGPVSSALADGYDERTFIHIWPDEGPPTTRVRVKGHGFGEDEEVWIYFDYIMQVIAFTDDEGNFPELGFIVGGRETPGIRTITAVGQESGRFDQVPFKIRSGHW